MCGRYLVDDEVYADIWEILNTPGMGTLSGTGSLPGAGLLSGTGTLPNMHPLPDIDTQPGTIPLPNISALPGNMAKNLVIGEVFPTNIAPVITCDGVETVKWGFPSWKGTGVIINARAETAFNKNMFRKPLLNRRCVIPSGGFYEWARTDGGKKKNKYLLRHQEERVLYMAGMIGVFRDTAGCDYNSFVILTTAANSSVAPIHNRMPVILAHDERDCWLRDDEFIKYALQRTGPGLFLEVQQ
jgi:putative SOS response-associated peptidase YedK